MNSFALEIWDEDSSLVSFYTVRREGEDETETDKFYLKFRGHPEYGKKLEELTTLLFDAIGEEHGAIEAIFSRHENWATALPPGSVRRLKLNYEGFPLRLYCYRVSENLVILFNGGVKKVRTVQEDPELNLLFIQANDYAKRIEAAFRDGTLRIINKGRSITDFQGNEELYL